MAMGNSCPAVVMVFQQGQPGKLKLCPKAIGFFDFLQWEIGPCGENMLP
jgi:hypothetical protein